MQYHTCIHTAMPQIPMIGTQITGITSPSVRHCYYSYSITMVWSASPFTQRNIQSVSK